MLSMLSKTFKFSLTFHQSYVIFYSSQFCSDFRKTEADLSIKSHCNSKTLGTAFIQKVTVELKNLIFIKLMYQLYLLIIALFICLSLANVYGYLVFTLGEVAEAIATEAVS